MTDRTAGQVKDDLRVQMMKILLCRDIPPALGRNVIDDVGQLIGISIGKRVSIKINIED